MKKTLYSQPIYRDAKEVLFYLGLNYFTRKDTLLGYWCFLNRLVYMVSVKAGLVEPSIETNQLKIKNLNNIRNVYAHCEVHLGLKNLEEHAKMHWQTASKHRETLRKFRNALAREGVFSYVETTFRPDARRRTPPAKIYGVNLILCFELMELIEGLLREKKAVVPATELELLFREVEILKENACNTGDDYAQEMIEQAEKKIDKILWAVAQGKRGTIPLHSGAFTAILFKKIKKWAYKGGVSVYSLVFPFLDSRSYSYSY